jgi:hypothetical protein
LALGIVVFLLMRPTPAQKDELSGTWTNPTPEGQNGIAKLQISTSGDQVNLHAWGKCDSNDCDWGTQIAQKNGEEVKATWSWTQSSAGQSRGRVASVTLKPDNGRLSVNVVNTYAQRPAGQRQFEFVRTP